MSATMQLLDSALAYATEWSVIPCGQDKKPLVAWKQYQTERATPEQITAWWTQYPDANVGIVTGKISGISVLDVDVKNGASGDETLASLLVKYDTSLDEVVCQRTWSGGRQFIFTYDPRARQGVACYGKGLDGRNDGGFVVVAPSVIEGNAYEWIVNPDALLPFPGWLLEAGKPQLREVTVNGSERKNPLGWDDELILKGAPMGERDHQAHRLIQHARNTGRTEMDCTARLALFGSHCQPPFDDEATRNITAKIRKAYSKPPHFGVAERSGHEPTSAEPEQQAARGKLMTMGEVQARIGKHVDWVVDRWFAVGDMRRYPERASLPSTRSSPTASRAACRSWGTRPSKGP